MSRQVRYTELSASVLNCFRVLVRFAFLLYFTIVTRAFIQPQFCGLRGLPSLLVLLSFHCAVESKGGRLSTAASSLWLQCQSPSKISSVFFRFVVRSADSPNNSNHILVPFILSMLPMASLFVVLTVLSLFQPSTVAALAQSTAWA